MENTLQVTLVGAGRYGQGLIGPKYSQGKFNPDAQLCSIVDTRSFNNNTRIKNTEFCPDIAEDLNKGYCLLHFFKYNNAKDWRKGLARIPNENDVVEIALKPEIVPKVFKEFVQTGVTKFILPKPVTTNLEELNQMEQLTEQYKLQTAVTSNWHYSDITKFTKAIIDKIIGKSIDEQDNCCEELKQINKTYSIESAELNYVKNRGDISDTTPAKCELSYALQILSSVGLVDMANDVPVVTQATPSSVTVQYNNDNVEKPIKVHTDIKLRANTQTGRERLLKIYLNDGDPEPDIIADYDVCLDKKNEKFGSVKVDIGQGKDRVAWEKTIKEDNLEIMYKKIFKTFKQPRTNSKTSNTVLTLHDYSFVAKQISNIQNEWEMLNV